MVARAASGASSAESRAFVNVLACRLNCVRLATQRDSLTCAKRLLSISSCKVTRDGKEEKGRKEGRERANSRQIGSNQPRELRAQREVAPTGHIEEQEAKSRHTLARTLFKDAASSLASRAKRRKCVFCLTVCTWLYAHVLKRGRVSKQASMFYLAQFESGPRLCSSRGTRTTRVPNFKLKLLLSLTLASLSLSPALGLPRA